MKKILLLAAFFALPAFAQEPLPPVDLQPAKADGFLAALEATYTGNPRIKAGREALQALDERMAQAISGFRPELSAGYERGRERRNINEAGYNLGNTRIRSITLSQPVFNGGETIAEINAARNLIKAGRAQLSQTEQETLLEAVTAYMDVVQGQSILDLSRKNVEVLSEQLKAAKSRFGVGEVTKTGVAQSDARVSRAKSEMAQAEGDLAGALARFERVIGFGPEGLLAEPAFNLPLPEALDAAVQDALQGNENLRFARYREKSASYDVNSRLAALLPDVALVGAVRRQEGGFGVTGVNSVNSDAITLQINVPLYQSGAEYSRIRQARDTREQRRFETADAQNTAREDAIRAFEALRAARTRIQSDEDAIAAARLALSGVKTERDYGSRTTLDVLDAEQELFGAEVARVRSRRNEVVAAYTLLSVLGKLTPEVLGLKVDVYDPTENYDTVKWLPAGW